MQSEIVLHKHGGATYAGKDATNLFRCITLRAGLKLFHKTGIKPTRGVGLKQMFAIAKEYTGKDYRRGQVDQCLADLDRWINTMKAAMPITDEREPEAA